MKNKICLSCGDFQVCNFRKEYERMIIKPEINELSCYKSNDENQNNKLIKYSEENLKDILIHVIGTLGTTDLVITLNPTTIKDLFNTEWVGMYRFCKIVHDEDQPENIVIFRNIRTPFNKSLNIVAFDLVTKENINI